MDNIQELLPKPSNEKLFTKDLVDIIIRRITTNTRDYNLIYNLLYNSLENDVYKLLDNYVNRTLEEILKQFKSRLNITEDIQVNKEYRPACKLEDLLSYIENQLKE